MSGEAKQKTVSLIFLLILFLLCTASCNTTEPPTPPNEPLPELTLELEDVSCTEAWITLTTNNLQLPATLNLLKDNTITKTINLQTADTLLYIDSLLPNQTYQYLVSSIQHQVTSNEITVTTLDTTSHNFTWQTWTFGEHGNSVLFDVAILGNEIWAVGEIYMKDSLGNPDNNAYNAIHWDGSEWELKRLNMLSSCNPITYPPLRAIWAFSENNIVVTSGGSIGWFDGITNIPDCTIRPLLTGSINKLWSSSSNDLYAVGNAGNIAHWNGSKWTKIESGTDVDLLDIWGSPDGTVWACGYTGDYATTVLLRYDGTIWNKVYEGNSSNQNNNEYIGPTSGIWTNSKFFTYVASWGKIYRQPNDNILNIKRLTPNFSDVAFAMRGTDHNNIFIAGQDGLVGHYNGVTYAEFNELKENAKNYLGVAVKDNIAVAVGVKYGGLSSQAVISIGRR
ncbi:MAG TPA: hypothetical protein VK870_12375 [Ignavibacteriaceae bacterium]|nr:hypothetical protein [Ignavibacteriaceae bacterium]